MKISKDLGTRVNNGGRSKPGILHQTWPWPHHGEAEVSKQLSLQLLSVLQRKKDILISLSWTKVHANNMQDRTQNQVKNPPSTTTTEQNNSALRTSNRIKKTPKTMNADFLLGNGSPETRTMGTSVIHKRVRLLKLFYQNIRGLRGKTSELLCHLQQDLPHLLCFSEHHLSQSEADIDSTFLKIYILVIYRSPIGNFNTFVTQSDKILQKLCTIKSNLIICGDVNVNYLQGRDKKSQLNALLNSYNLFSIVQFPTRTYSNSISANDNIFIDTTKIDTCAIIPAMNGLFDHDA